VHSATHNTSPSRLEIVRPPGGLKFIAYERLEEVEGASNPLGLSPRLFSRQVPSPTVGSSLRGGVGGGRSHKARRLARLMQRFPHGAEGSSFFQKRVPETAPDWLQTTIVSTPNGTTSRALVLADMAHVVWAVNLACLGFHVWPYLHDRPEVADELRVTSILGAKAPDLGQGIGKWRWSYTQQHGDNVMYEVLLDERQGRWRRIASAGRRQRTPPGGSVHHPHTDRPRAGNPCARAGLEVSPRSRIRGETEGEMQPTAVRAAIAAALLVLTIAGAAATSARAENTPRLRQTFDIERHRGTRGLRPENTLAAFGKALQIGVTTLELDTGVTKDGVVVVSHERRISPLECQDTGGNHVVGRLIRDLTLAEIQTLDCGTRHPPNPATDPFVGTREAVPGTHMPTLAQVFELANRYGADGVQFNIETKIDPTVDDTVPPAEFASRVLGVIERFGMVERSLLQSFDWRTLVEAKKQRPAVRTVALAQAPTIFPGTPWTAGVPIAADAWQGSLAKVVKSIGATILSPRFQDLTDPLIAAAHRQGLHVVPWTVDDAPTMGSLIEARRGRDHQRLPRHPPQRRRLEGTVSAEAARCAVRRRRTPRRTRLSAREHDPGLRLRALEGRHDPRAGHGRDEGRDARRLARPRRERRPLPRHRTRHARRSALSLRRQADQGPDAAQIKTLDCGFTDPGFPQQVRVPTQMPTLQGRPQAGSATGTGGIWKISTKRSKSMRLPLTRALPLSIASAGLSSPVSRGWSDASVSRKRSASVSGPSSTSSAPSSTRAWTTISPSRSSYPTRRSRAASGRKVERSARRIVSTVAISSGRGSGIDCAPHRPSRRTMSSSPRPYSVSS
jgi:glycerophosphoryl diester phosphodiesterase